MGSSNTLADKLMTSVGSHYHADTAAAAAAATAAAPGAGPRSRMGSKESLSCDPEERAERAFHIVATGGAITVGASLARAMSLIGHSYPKQAWLQEFVKDLCNGRDSLDLEDFEVIATAYAKREKVFLSNIFTAKAEVEGWGQEIPAALLPELLCDADVSLMRGATEELVADSPPMMSLDSFVKLYEYAALRAGLTMEEYERCCDFFNDSLYKDASGASMITVSDFTRGLSFNDHLMNLVGGTEPTEKVGREAAERTRFGNVELNPARWRVSSAVASPTEKRAVVSRLSTEGTSSTSTVARRRSTVARRISMAGPSDRAASKLTDGGGIYVGINLEAFLLAVRVMHQRVESAIENIVNQYDRIQTSDLVQVFDDLGFISALPQEAEHFLAIRRQDIGLSARSSMTHNEGYLTPDDVYAVVMNYCSADGFTAVDWQDLGSVFDRFDEDGSDTLTVGELGPVIRYLGYEPSHYRIYDFAEEVGLQHDSEFDRIQFKTMVGKYRKRTLQGVRMLFCDDRPGCPESTRADACVSSDRVEELMRSIGYDIDDGDIEIQRLLQQHCPDESIMNFKQLKMMESCLRQQRRQIIERNGGFTDRELQDHKRDFEENSVNGVMQQKNLRRCLQKLFTSSLSNDKSLHMRIKSMVDEADEDRNGQFEEGEYLLLMRKVSEELERMMLLNGLQLRDDLGFSSLEMKQFRDLFWETDVDGSGSIDFNELVEIIGNIVAMTTESERQLRDYFRRVDQDNGDSLDFWEFLRLMRLLQEDNWSNIASGHGG
jgi:Ca2+-binding EF-hand superfamily protein